MYSVTREDLIVGVGSFLMMVLMTIGFIILALRTVRVSRHGATGANLIDATELPGIRLGASGSGRDLMSCPGVRCKATNPPHSKYCRMCGAKLSRELFPRADGGR